MPTSLQGVAIAGLFSLDIDVQDGSNAPVAKIDSSTTYPKHVIRVTNFRPAFPG